MTFIVADPRDDGDGFSLGGICNQDLVWIHLTPSSIPPLPHSLCPYEQRK